MVYTDVVVSCSAATAGARRRRHPGVVVERHLRLDGAVAQLHGDAREHALAVRAARVVVGARDRSAVGQHLRREAPEVVVAVRRRVAGRVGLLRQQPGPTSYS